MKYLIASDIHGSAYWCGRLMERVEAERPDKILILGDVLYHGPRNALPRDYDPKGVIAMLNPLAPAIVAVRGNCEAEVDQMVLDFPCMADYAEIVDPGGRTLWLTHGHLWNPGNLPPLQPGSAFLYGHTHVKVLEEVEGGVTVFNPGSVSIPKDGSHSFGVYEDGRFRLELLEEG
ncbi:phosphodiesterase [Coriobacteriaceae bacterium]|nr:phosphodiesterase [Coriobacteriaceae bacterium]